MNDSLKFPVHSTLKIQKTMSNPAVSAYATVPLSFTVVGVNHPDIVDLVMKALDYLGVTGPCKLRIRGQVNPRDGYENTVELKEGRGTRLAVQNDKGECFECYLNSRYLNHKSLHNLFSSRLKANCFFLSEVEPKMAEAPVVPIAQVPFLPVVAQKRIIELRQKVDKTIADLQFNEDDIVKLNALLQNAYIRRLELEKYADDLIKEIDQPNFLSR
jgi:hypothetical protein